MVAHAEKYSSHKSTDADILERAEYDAYGNIYHYYDGDFTNPRPASSCNNPVAFTGQRLDSLNSHALQLYYFKNRYYDPANGRFLQRDPYGMKDMNSIIRFNKTGSMKFIIGLKPLKQYHDGMNLYEYVRSSPIKKFDPFGLRDLTPGERPPACGNCGPDITPHLKNMRKELRNFFYNLGGYGVGSNRLDEEDRKSLCKGRWYPRNNGEWALDGWEIEHLKDGWKKDWFPKGDFDKCATKDCENTVRVGSGCYGKDEVNYYAYGVMTSICSIHFPDDFYESYYFQNELVDNYSWVYAFVPRNNPECKQAWFRAGYSGDPTEVSCGNSTYCTSDCKGCLPYLDVKWMYLNRNDIATIKVAP